MTKGARRTPAIRPIRGVFCLAISVVLFAAAVPAEDLVTLTNGWQVRRLTKTDAEKHLPVRLHGVVLGEEVPGYGGFAIQDSTGGIYVESTKATVAQLHPGDMVDIEGISDPGVFVPLVAATSVRKTGTAALPEPREVTFEDLASGNLEAQWVEVRGIVRSCELPTNDKRKCMMELAIGGGRLTVRWNVPNMQTPMVDAEVRLRGVCYYLTNRKRQFLSPMLAVPNEVPIITERPPPPDPFATPVRPVSSLMQFAPGGLDGHRVRVRGLVIRQQPGESLWLRDGDRGLLVQTSQSGNLQAGDEVDVLGFPAQGEFSPILEDAIFQKSPLPAIPPSPLWLAKAAAAGDHDGDLVELEAILSRREHSPGGWVLTLNAGSGTKFEAFLPLPDGQPAPAQALPGSHLRITGVCSVFRNHTGFVSGRSHAQSFQLLLRSPADLNVIQPPPWWNRERVIWLLGSIASVSILGIAWVVVAAHMRLREQAASRARAEAEFSAILGERNRVAREIHDILAQGLSAIVLHLDLAKDEFHQVSRQTACHLEIALGVARNSMTDASDAVWNLRSQALERNDLPGALECVLRQLTDGTSVGTRFELTGQPRRLPPAMENAILRIGQEAITNATRHASAKHIEVTVSYDEKLVGLKVSDDGCGFEPDRLPKAGGFGLVGVSERAAQLGGKLNVGSQPGQGTVISVAVPLAS